MAVQAAARRDSPALGIASILIGMTCISVQDVMIKQLSGGYPLHQIVFLRSVIAVVVSLGLVQMEGGWRILATRRPGAHAIRALLVVAANMLFFAGLAAMPIAEATALFFVAPLFITLLSIPMLGEKVGPRRLAATVAGLFGVVIMMRPGADMARSFDLAALLPVGAALAYALMQIMTRQLGIAAKASALAIYIQSMMIVVSAGFFAIAGDGRFAEGTDDPSLDFLLRAWRWPEGGDVWLFVGIGVMSSAIGYLLSQAYRLASAATVAPFEYIALPLAVMWGWSIFGEVPDAWIASGIAVIVGAGLYVFLRERSRGRPVATKRPLRRW